MATAYFLQAVLTVTLLIGLGLGYDGDPRVHKQEDKETNIVGVEDEYELGSPVDLIFLRPASSRRWCPQSKNCKKKGGTCKNKRTCVGISTKGCSRGCRCCIPSCVFGGKKYPEKAFLEESCMELQCINENWKYTEKVQHEKCGSCGIHGDTPTFITFDRHIGHGLTYYFNGVGTYVMTQNGLNNSSTFGLNPTFEQCDEDLRSCVTKFTYYEPGIEIEVTLPARNLNVYCSDPSNDPATNPLCMIKVFVNGTEQVIGKTTRSFDTEDDGTVLVFKHNHIGDDVHQGGQHGNVVDVVDHGDDLICMNMVVSKGLSVSLCLLHWDYAYLHVRAMTSLKSELSELYGLCDTFTGTTQRYFTDRNGSIEGDADIFAETWKTAEILSSAVGRQVKQVPVTGTCDCDYSKDGGCFIKVRPDNNLACKCRYDRLWHCSGSVVQCQDTSSQYCKTPDLSIQSCVEGGGDCGGYAENQCGCNYHSGGCTIDQAAPPNTACHCNYEGGWRCSGYVTSCKNGGSKLCTTPEANLPSCYQGNGDCGGYDDSCDCDYHSHGVFSGGGCKISRKAPDYTACHCYYKGGWSCGGSVRYCDPFNSLCSSPTDSKDSCNLGEGDCGGY